MSKALRRSGGSRGAEPPWGISSKFLKKEKENVQYLFHIRYHCEQRGFFNILGKNRWRKEMHHSSELKIGWNEDDHKWNDIFFKFYSRNSNFQQISNGNLENLNFCCHYDIHFSIHMEQRICTTYIMDEAIAGDSPADSPGWRISSNGNFIHINTSGWRFSWLENLQQWFVASLGFSWLEILLAGESPAMIDGLKSASLES